jgi:hypothetical protein
MFNAEVVEFRLGLLNVSGRASDRRHGKRHCSRFALPGSRPVTMAQWTPTVLGIAEASYVAIELGSIALCEWPEWGMGRRSAKQKGTTAEGPKAADRLPKKC